MKIRKLMAESINESVISKWPAVANNGENAISGVWQCNGSKAGVRLANGVANGVAEIRRINVSMAAMCIMAKCG
jgi:hypothetical protein